MAREKKDPGVELIERTAKRVLERAEHGGLPVLEVPSRSLSNVRYDPDVGFFQIGDKRKKRTLRVNTARTFAQTLRLMALSKRMIETDDFATKREAYYVSKNWGDCRFGEQTESDAVMDDVEALASREGVFREQLRFYPEEHGGSVAGNLLIRERDPETGGTLTVDCSSLGSGGYSVPRSVEHLELRTSAKFVLAIETGGMFQRLAGHRFWRKHDCILIELAGVPSRATRRSRWPPTSRTRIPRGRSGSSPSSSRAPWMRYGFVTGSRWSTPPTPSWSSSCVASPKSPTLAPSLPSSTTPSSSRSQR